MVTMRWWSCIYCNSVVANMRGDGATMKRNDYDFTSINFQRLVPYFAQSFAFLLHIEQVYFPPDVAAHGWEVVMRSQPRGVCTFSTHQVPDEVCCISLRRASDFPGLQATSLDLDLTPQTPILKKVVEVAPEVVAH